MSPSGRMEQGLEQREEWREPSMSPSGRMEQGLEQRGVARAVHEPARANGARRKTLSFCT